MFSSRFNAGEKVVGEYGKGASLGAIEVLCDAPRPAKVVAIRDTELVKLSTSVFQFIIKKYPNVVVRFSRLVGRALLERSSTSRDEQGTPTNLTTVAVLGIGPDAPLSTFSKRLAAELMHIESTLLVDKVGLFRLSLSLSLASVESRVHSLTHMQLHSDDHESVRYCSRRILWRCVIDSMARRNGGKVPNRAVPMRRELHQVDSSMHPSSRLHLGDCVESW